MSFLLAICIRLLTGIFKAPKTQSRASKGTSKSNNIYLSSLSKAEAAKAAYESAVAETVQEISARFRCDEHDRVCFFDSFGKHMVYAKPDIVAHARLVVSGGFSHPCSYSTIHR